MNNIVCKKENSHNTIDDNNDLNNDENNDEKNIQNNNNEPLPYFPEDLDINEKIKNILEGKENITAIMDGKNATSTVRYLQDSVLRGSTFGKNVVAANGSEAAGTATSARVQDISVIHAGAGDDVINFSTEKYSYGDTVVYGGTGNDKIWMSSGNDQIFGQEGNDEIYSFSGLRDLIFNRNTTVVGNHGILHDSIHVT